MNPITKLAGFALILIASFGAAFGVGRAVGSGDDDPSPRPPTAASTTTTTAPMDHGAHS
ncbi:MAG: hypothetical protein ACTHN0_10005 [Aquihabitans sp.]